MYLPKQDIYTYLIALESDEEIQGIKVYQNQPDVFTELPVVTFYVANNSVETDLSNNIAYQDVTIIIDIWTRTSSEGGKILNKVEQIMRNNLYTLEFSSDIPNTDQAVKHINCRFSTKI